MTITAIAITKTYNNKRQLADVAIEFDYSLRIENIKLIDNGKKLFVEFSKTERGKSRKSYPDVIPLNQIIRQYIELEVIREYYRLEEVGKE